jgi:hypothetical protein
LIYLNPFSTDEFKFINGNLRFSFIKDDTKSSNESASGKKITVAKLVRVACPAAGTGLIDTLLDNVVNVTPNQFIFWLVRDVVVNSNSIFKVTCPKRHLPYLMLHLLKQM